MSARYRQPPRPQEWMSEAEYRSRRRTMGYGTPKQRKRDPEHKSVVVEFSTWAASTDAVKAWEGQR